MKNEYIIVNKTAIQKRIEELESKRGSDECSDPRDYSYLCGKIHQLEQVLLFSTPLIPEIEKAFDIGSLKTEQCYNKTNGFVSGIIHTDKQDYISNLKLDI